MILVRVCDVCKRPSGEYTLCPDCFNLMQEGKVKKCNNCGKWYLSSNLCECVKGNAFYQNERPSHTALQEEPDYKFKAVPKKSGCAPGCLIVFLILVAIIAVIIAIPLIKEDKKADDETTVVTKVTKEAPVLDSEEPSDLSDLTTITILIEAKDDYDEVVVELCVYDDSNSIIAKKYLTETNLRKGNTYKVTYTMPLSEAWDADRYTYRVYNYE